MGVLPLRLERTRRLQRGWLVVCTRCTLLECQFIVEFAGVRQGCFGVKLSLDFFLYNNHNKKFAKDSGLAKIESKVLPKVIRTETRRHGGWC
jgi:hypothetical protein